MEVKTKEIRKYINLEFNEKDLLILRDEIDKIVPVIDSYNDSYKVRESGKIIPIKLNELRDVISSSLNQLVDKE